MPEETTTPEQPEVSAPSSENVTTPPEQKPETPAADENEFDASAFEVEYGLPEGTLNGAKTAEEATAVIRQFANTMLSAGFLAPGKTPAEKPAEKTPEKPATPSETPSGMEQILARLDKMESHFKSQREQLEQQRQQETLQRVVAELDSWDSPKYGKKGQRNYHQLRAAQEILELATTHEAGYIAQGKTPPTAEAILRQVRVFHDTDYTPTKKAAAEKQQPLGTPGASRKTADAGEPRSIHHAMFGVK